MSIELSWEEVRPYVCKYFDILEEESRVARYTGNAEGLSSNRYNCIFFVARLGETLPRLSPKNMLKTDMVLYKTSLDRNKLIHDT